MPWSRVRSARGWPGGSGPLPVLVSPLEFLPALASLAVRVAGCPVRVSLPFACRHAIPCGLWVPRARSGCPSGPRLVSVACVCARAPAACSPPPPSVLVWRVHYARLCCRAPVALFQAVLASLRFLPRSRVPPIQLVGGLARPRRPLALLGVARPPAAGLLLCAGFVRCGGGTRAPRGGASRLGVGRPGCSALPPLTARPLVRAAGAHYPLAFGAGSAGVETNHQAHCARSCMLAERAVGAERGCPGGGAFCLGVGRPGSGAHPRPTARPLGRASGPHYPLAVGAGDAGVGTRHQSDSARSCELALRAVGAARGCPGGARLAWLWGVRSWALVHAPPAFLWGVRLGPTTHWLWVRGVQASGLVTNPTARALASWLCALWGRHEGAQGGRLLPRCGASRVRRSPTPDRPSFGACGRGPLPIAFCCGMCGRGDPSPTPQRALLRAGFASCWGGRRAPGGGGSCLGVGRLGLGAPPPPTARPLGCAAGAEHPLAVGAGTAGVGTHHQPHSARSCELALRALEAERGFLGGCLLPGCGASWVGLSSTPDRPSFGVCGRGPLPTGCGCGGCGRGDLSPTPQRALLRAGFARCGGGRRAPRGGASCLCVGRLGSGALPPPTGRPLGRVAGAYYPLAVGAGDAGVGTCHQPHTACTCELALRAMGVARGRSFGHNPNNSCRAPTSLGAPEHFLIFPNTQAPHLSWRRAARGIFKPMATKLNRMQKEIAFANGSNQLLLP